MYHKLLITGASGLLGGRLQMIAVDRDLEVLGISRDVSHQVKGRVRSVDLENTASVNLLLEQERPTCIIHAAALTNVDHCELHPEQAARLHVEASANLARWADRSDCRMIYISTDAVFAAQEFREPFKETDQVSPINVYARTKQAGELAVLQEAKNSLIIRTNLFGRNLYRSFHSLVEWALSTLARGEQVSGFTDVWFNPLSATTLSNCLLSLSSSTLTGTLHLGARDIVSKFEFLRRLAVRAGYPADRIIPKSVHQMSFIAPRPHFTGLNVQLAEKVFGFALPAIENELGQY